MRLSPGYNVKESAEMSKRTTNILLILALLTGLSLMLYPTFSDLWNAMHQSRTIATYTEAVAELDSAVYEKELEAARAYNESLEDWVRYYPDEAAMETYDSLLNVTGSGVMGYIEIPKINVLLPIYHTTDEAVLQIAVGHVVGSSLPVGGESTHCVLSGHRGLPSATLFTNLDRLELGDTFFLHVLNETLAYEVDQITVIEPEELSALNVEEGADLCTLVTCTPYGVNSHRLLVRGRRVETAQEETHVPTGQIIGNVSQIDETIVAVCTGVPVLLALILVLMIRTRKKR